MENNFKKLCMLLFACATIFGLSYNNSITVKATDNLQMTTTGQAVEVTTSSAVTTSGQVIVYVEKQPKYTLRIHGMHYANEDDLYHLWNHGKLVTGGTLGMYGSLMFANDDGIIIDGRVNATTYTDKSYITINNGNSFIVGYSGYTGRGWAWAARNTYVGNNRYSKYDFFYCDYDTGVIQKNVIVDGYTLGEDGDMIESEKNNTSFNYVLNKTGIKAKTITPIL